MAVVYPTWGSPQTIEKLCASSSFVQMHPTMQERVKELIEASEGRVGLGIGFRSEAQQRAMFLDRYVVDDHGQTVWDGRRWSKKSPNLATAAPPGRSMHEIGLAADLTGDHAWVVSNSSRFALNNFAFVNNEPWHVQPFELPNSRSQYELAGSPWKTRSPTVEPVPGGIPPVEVVPEMRGPFVGQLQGVLINLGLISDTVANRDEYYGPATQKVVKAFQLSKGLKDDGKVGPKTWAALLNA